MFVIQRLTLDKEDELIIEKITETDQKVICVINKIDQIENKNKLLPFIEKLSSFKVFHEILPISAKTKDGINQLESIIMSNLPENMHIYSQDDFVIQDGGEFMISELIREKIIRKLGDELPHDIFVEINILDEKDNVTEIHATIFVNRKSQKQIVIGAKGEVLKQIGTEARIEIEKYLDSKVFLKTWVKVKKNWNTDSGFINSLGVGNKHESK